jgi:sulfite exporter TauE/SafE
VNATPDILAALVLGLLASAHCSLMCGGIAGALALGMQPKGERSRWTLLLSYQVGRIGAYALAGASIAGVGSLAVGWLDQNQVRLGLRIASSVLLALAGFALLGIGHAPAERWGARLWVRIAPHARRLLPVRHPAQALAFGALWGFMPCGFVYTVLLLSWLNLDPLRSAAIMLAFGLGTVPALLLVQWRVHAFQRSLQRLGPARLRTVAGAMLLCFAVVGIVVPLAAPDLIGWAHRWLPFDCISL